MILKKTTITDKKVLRFLYSKYGDSIGSLSRIGGKMSGEKSQAFKFAIGSNNYVIRFNLGTDHGYRKDKTAYEKFNSEEVPIPRTIDIGVFADYKYSITEQCKGKTLDKLNTKSTKGTMENLFDVMTSIHKINPLGEGYGEWDSETLNAPEKSHDYMIDKVINRDLWRDLAQKYPYFDLNQINGLADQLEGHRAYIPIERKLVHADFGFNNVLSDDETITGVIDWGEAIYGDPLYDLAWLCIWSDIPETVSFDYKSAFSNYAKERGLKYNNYDERLKLYILVIGISSLEIFAENDREDDFIGTIYCMQRNGIEC